MSSVSQQAINLIEKSNTILCITRQYPSTDGVASVMGLQVLLDRLGKETTCIVPQGASKHFEFLTGYTSLEKEIKDKGAFRLSLDHNADGVEYEIKDGKLEVIVQPTAGKLKSEDIQVQKLYQDFDLIITLDTPNLESLGNIYRHNSQCFANNTILNISSRADDESFGKINLVDTKKASSSEILLDLIDTNPTWNPLLDRDLATIILTGVIGSTGSFLEANTTPSSLIAASRLQDAGADQSGVIENLFKKKSLETLKVWGRILGNLRVDEEYAIASSVLTKADFELTGANPKAIDNISQNLLRFVAGSDYAVLIIEEPDTTNIEIRSQNPATDWESLQHIFEGQIRNGGLDLEIKDQSVGEIETGILQTLRKLQAHKIEPEVSVQPKEETAKAKTKKAVIAKDSKFPIHNSAPSHEGSAEVPANIPFKAPLQEHELTGEVGDSGKTGYDPKKSGIPKK